MAAEAISTIYNGSIPALNIAKQVFKQLNLNHKTEMGQILAQVCSKISGGPETAVSQQDEETTGMILAASICQHKTKRNARTINAMGAKYKPVAKKKRPVPVSMPILKRQPYKPLPVPVLPSFPVHPPRIEDFMYTSRLTKERVDIILGNMDADFLSEDERRLIFWVLTQNEQAVAFEDRERGQFSKKYFPDYIMETVPHTPWQLPPIPIPRAIKTEVEKLLRDQFESGNLERSYSSYRARMFTVKKPSGGLRIVWDLQELNKYSVQDAMLPPNISEFAESFVGHSIYGTLDLYSGYHQRAIHPDSRPLTACQTPTDLGNVQLTSLPMGYTNSMQEFQRSTSHLLGPLEPDEAGPFVDDIGVKGPDTRYEDEPIPENPNIRRFVWEYAHTLFKTFRLLIEAGVTAAGKKLVLAVRQVIIVGYICDLDGMRPNHGVVTKVLRWPIPRSVTEVRGYLGTVGVTRNWIKNFARIAKPLTELTKLKNHEFQWSEQAQHAFDILKEKVKNVTALKRLDIELAKRASLTFVEGELNEGRIILAVDSSNKAIGYVLYQVFRSSDKDLAPTDAKNTTRRQQADLKRYPLRFGSITLNETESSYSQPKVELYGLFRALKALESIVWGINIRVEADASFLAAMVNSPGLPSASTTRWAAYIKLFDMEIVHIKAAQHVAPDGLSRRPPADEDTTNTEISEEDERERGSFIRAARKYGFAEPPREVPLVPEPTDSHYIAMTRLSARLGEPPDVVARRRGRFPEQLHLAFAEPTRNPAEVICTFMTVIVPCKKDEDVDPLMMPVQTRRMRQAEDRVKRPESPEPPPEPHERADDNDSQVEDLAHPNTIIDEDQEENWKNIISYLQTMNVPKGVKNAKSFRQSALRFFIRKGALWYRGKEGPKRVILNKNEREEIIRQAHDESGHRGRDPTYKKIWDFYYWPKMLTQVAIYCRTCPRCQLRSSYHPKVMINPTWVPTVLRKFNLDVVEMGIKSKGYEYIVDIRDDLTGWLEARMLVRKSSEAVAAFLWQDVICRFGCVPQITTDNGTEFKKAVNILARKYGITVVRISPYNPVANGMIERGHRTWINSIWKLCGKRKDKWSEWFYSAIWADRVTTRKSTGFSPYYLLYGRPHLFPFNLRDETWYTIKWHDVETTEELLAVRAIQIRQMRMDRRKGAKTNKDSRIQAAREYAVKNARRLISGIYRDGEFVIVALKGPGIVRGSGLAKSDDTWAGPFKINKRFKSGSYQLRELDGAIIKGSVPAGHLKPFYTRRNQIKGGLLLSGDESSDGNEQFATDSDNAQSHESDYRE